MAHVSIRIATMADYDEICRLTAQVDAYHAERIPEVFRHCEGPARPPDMVASWVEADDADYLLAEIGGEVVGFLNIRAAAHPDFRVFQPHAYALVENLVVDEAQRRHGIGTLLLKAAKLWARDHGLEFIQLTVWCANTAAVEFYRKHGFETLTCRMELKLDRP